MMKKLLAAAAALALALTLTACTGTVEQLPTLDLGTSSSAVSSGESGVSSGVESGTESQPEAAQPDPVSDKDFDDTLDGLCQYLEANRGVTGEPTEMAYETIGAVGGFRYRFHLNGSTVQVEVYEYDVENLDEQGQVCWDSVKSQGFFTLLDKEIPATLNENGKYMMIYTDTSTNEANVSQKERVMDLFLGFKA